jgi:uracil phosphoribosyltransferase
MLDLRHATLEAAMSGNVHELTHPLIQHKLTLLRDRERSTSGFRRLLHEIGMLMAYELTRDMPTQAVEVETPLERTTGRMIDGKKIVLVPILRAGLGLVDGMLEVVPGARVGHIGLYRDPATLAAVEYYFKMPDHLGARDAIVLDPMLATGHSAAAAVTRLKAAGPRSIRLACLLAAPEGIAHLHAVHPDVPLVTCAIDRCLNDHGYILPGLGDAGDRIFGTR